ncbi:hypothetical protein A4G18_00305 [Pasteurellaceae bacterium Pebbles2]|nr:hypothetical protein [Pasteurellaceae bacterium Pebbles2]
MKKLAAIALALFSANVLANTEATPQTAAPEVTTEMLKSAIENKQPIAAVQVFNTFGKEPKLIKGNKLSRSKQRELCLVINNIQPLEKNRLAVFFKAPQAMEMNSLQPNATLNFSEDKTEILAVFDKPQMHNNAVVQCWKFGPKDPVGTYAMEAQFNSTVFKGLQFQILK